MFKASLIHFMALIAISFQTIGNANATVNVGVRNDTPPFSRPATQDENRTHGGFLVDICHEVLVGIGVDYKLQKITSENRFKKLRSGEVDFLCEPTSITVNRLQEYAFSFPLFISGLSFAQVKSIDLQRDRDVVGFLRNTTAADGIKTLLDSNVFGVYSDNLREEISKNEKTIRKEFESHIKGVLALCTNKISYYIADKDILDGLISQQPNCDAFQARETYTREIYALTFLSPINKEFQKFSAERQKFLTNLFWNTQVELFRLFQAHRIDDIFKLHFGGKKMSDELRVFYNIGKINPH